VLDFNKLISLHLQRDLKAKQIARYYPSEVGSCLRKVYYSYKHPKPLEEDLIKIFETGNILHSFIVEVLKSEKDPDVKLINQEVPVKLILKDYVISGRIDDILVIKSSGKVYLVEVKSTSMLRAVKSPSKHHILQLQFYMHATGIHNGMLMYIEKNTLQTMTFEVDYKEEIVKHALDRFEILHKSLIANKSPDAEARKDKDMHWMCRRCDYFDECYKETPASREYPLMKREVNNV
jgi:hypothetical protein